MTNLKNHSVARKITLQFGLILLLTGFAIVMAIFIMSSSKNSAQMFFEKAIPTKDWGNLAYQNTLLGLSDVQIYSTTHDEARRHSAIEYLKVVMNCFNEIKQRVSGDDAVLVDSMIAKSARYNTIVHNNIILANEMTAIHNDMNTIKDQYFFPNIEKLQKAVIANANKNNAKESAQRLKVISDLHWKNNLTRSRHKRSATL